MKLQARDAGIGDHQAMADFLSKLAARGLLVGALPFYAACSCEPRLVVRSPAALVGVAIPIQPSKAECAQLCGTAATTCERIPVAVNPVSAELRTADLPEYTVLCTIPRYCPGGRLPAGYVATAPQSTATGEHFAELARLEAASVRAFLELAVELELHGAPRGLVEVARRAASDEIAHAAIASQLAERFGATPTAAIVTATPPRSLSEVLVENAVEGLVSERYGAALAAVRAERASDPVVGHAMARIARDEARHAALAEAVHDWGMSNVSETARRRVLEGRDRARDALRSAIDIEPSAELAMLGGMPSATVANDVLAATT